MTLKKASQRLSGCSRQDPGRSVLIAEDAESWSRYIQVLAFEDGSLMAEAVSNINLGPAEQWDAEHGGLLTRIGWHPAEDGGSPNLCVVHPTVTPPVGEVARMICRTLRMVSDIGGKTDPLRVKSPGLDRLVGLLIAAKDIRGPLEA
jgi:hypothetical protein